MSFKAGVQYGDFEGSAAADRADKSDLGEYLRSKGLMQQSEFLVAVELWVGENHGGKVAPPSISALVVDAPDYDGAVRDVLNQDPVPVRKIDLPISLDQFLGLFKRFAVTLTIRGGDLGGKNSREVWTGNDIAHPEKHGCGVSPMGAKPLAHAQRADCP